MHSFTSDVQMIHSKAGTILEKITWVAEGWGFGGGGALMRVLYKQTVTEVNMVEKQFDFKV